MSVSQTPYQEVQERLAEVAPAWPMAHLVGIQGMQQLLADAMQRVRDSHKVQMKEIGGEATEAEMGDINVSGDHTATHYHLPTPPSSMPSIVKKCLPLAATLALGGAAGIAAPLLLAWWNKPAPPAPQPPAVSQDWQLGIEVVNP